MTIEVTDIDGVVCLTLNRPPVNALDAHTLAGLQDFLHAHDRQTPLVITGAGPMYDGKAIMLTLTFANAGTITVVAPVTNPQNGGSSYFLD